MARKSTDRRLEASRATSIRRTLCLVGLGVFVVMAAIALITGLALDRAQKALTRTAFSESQLNLLNQLDAAVNAQVAAGILHVPTAHGIQSDAILAQYRASIDAEHRFLIAHGGADDTASERIVSNRLAALANRIKADWGSPNHAKTLASDLAAFQALVSSTVRQEREEVLDARAEFERTRSIIAAAAMILPLLGAGLGGMALWTLLRRMRKPLRQFENAMLALGAGERVPLGNLGFAEFAGLTSGFERMADEIEEQRKALASINERLEREVAARTAQLQARNSQLAEIEESRRRFFAQISHELRTPITALCCEAEISLRGPDDNAEALRESLREVLAQGAMVQRCLSDLLTISQAEDGKLAMVQEPFDLAEALRGSLALARPFARASETRIDAAFADANFPLLGDAVWMQQALLALIDNAVKFSPGAVVTVRLKRQGQAIRLTISDQGPGVSTEALPRLFEPFHQEPAGRTRGGAGLGLSIARWVVEHHDGRIAATNRNGKGLVMSLIFPLTSAETHNECLVG